MATLGKQLMDFIERECLRDWSGSSSRNADHDWSYDAEAKINEFAGKLVYDAAHRFVEAKMNDIREAFGMPPVPMKQYDIQTDEEPEQKEASDGN